MKQLGTTELQYALGDTQLILSTAGGGKSILALTEAISTLKENKVKNFFWASNEMSILSTSPWFNLMEFALSRDVTPKVSWSVEEAKDLFKTVPAIPTLIDGCIFSFLNDRELSRHDIYKLLKDKFDELNAANAVFIIDNNYCDFKTTRGRISDSNRIKLIGEVLKEVAKEFNSFVIFTAQLPRMNADSSVTVAQRVTDIYGFGNRAERKIFDHIQVAEFDRRTSRTSITHITP